MNQIYRVERAYDWDTTYSDYTEALNQCKLQSIQDGGRAYRIVGEIHRLKAIVPHVSQIISETVPCKKSKSESLED